MPGGVSLRLEYSFFSEVETKFLKSCIVPKNKKEDPLGSLNAFFEPKTSKKIMVVPNCEIDFFFEKWRFNSCAF